MHKDSKTESTDEFTPWILSDLGVLDGADYDDGEAELTAQDASVAAEHECLAAWRNSGGPNWATTTSARRATVTAASPSPRGAGGTPPSPPTSSSGWWC